MDPYDDPALRPPETHAQREKRHFLEEVRARAKERRRTRWRRVLSVFRS